MPRIDRSQLEEDWLDDDDNFLIDDDDQPTKKDRLIRPTRSDRDWEENRKNLINRKLRRDHRE